MAINTYGVKTGEFGQYDIADFRPLSLSVSRTMEDLQDRNQVVWNMGGKENTSEETEAASSQKIENVSQRRS